MLSENQLLLERKKHFPNFKESSTESKRIQSTHFSDHLLKFLLHLIEQKKLEIRNAQTHQAEFSIRFFKCRKMNNPVKI